jgi:hypothetical protein
MVWEPYALAVVFGLVVSAAIYFIVMWPATEDELEEQAETEEADER